jgi:membrane-associated phospholipid phosphatase
VTGHRVVALSGDKGDFRHVNDFANSTSWLHGFMVFMAKDGVALLALCLLAGWWIGRRDDSARKVALAVWAAIAAVIAVILVQPIADAAKEQRPFVVLHTHKLIAHAADYGFPSDHATAAGAVAAGLTFLSWRLGLVTWLIALLIAFSRVYVGVHFPQDVLAGLALGTVIAVIGVFLVVPLLTRVVTWLGTTPIRPLVARSELREQPL